MERKIKFNKKVIYKIVKRILDIVISIIGLIICIPILVICGVLIKLESRGPLIYKQVRVGLKGKHFTIYKLRSMHIDSEIKGPQWADKDDKRITKIGKFIRNKRIDEIPQFINILKGDMSVVGPRPERPYFVDVFSQRIPDFKKRLSIKPGLTGWAQVNGGYNLNPQEKLQMDLYYISNQSLLLDLKIILYTIKIVLTGKGAR